MKFSNKSGLFIVEQLITAIQANKEYLSDIDGAVGDGDHGINMNKGFTLAREELDNQTMNLSDGLMTISKVLVNKIGGSMGPLYGSLFRGLSVASRISEQIDKEVMFAMLEKASNNVKQLTTAEVGDKTLIDVLDPAIAAYEQALQQNKSFIECLDAMTHASEKGWQSTKDLIAKVGRGSRLGERTVGHLDAGATSCHIILNTIAESAMTLLQKQG